MHEAEHTQQPGERVQGQPAPGGGTVLMPPASAGLSGGLAGAQSVHYAPDSFGAALQGASSVALSTVTTAAGSMSYGVLLISSCFHYLVCHLCSGLGA